MTQRIEYTYGLIWRMDHTFHIARFVSWVKGKRQVKALFSLVNEYGERLGFWGTATEGMAELHPSLKRVFERKDRFAWEAEDTDPQFAYVDNPVATKRFFMELLTSLAEVGQDAFHWLDRYSQAMNKDHFLPGQWRLSLAVFLSETKMTCRALSGKR